MLALATAFRIFFLLAGVLAAMWVPAWIYVATEQHELTSNLGSMGWHAHEMVFGYLGAVLAGFLLTATRNWTKLPTLDGAPLGALVVLWALGRIAVLQTRALPDLLPAVIDGLFFAVVAVAIAIPIARARSRRNTAFPLLVALIGACDVVVHLHVLALLPRWSARAFDVAIDAIVLIIVIFAGRIIPLFTRNATGSAVRARGWLDIAGLAAMVLLLVARAIAPHHEATHVVTIAAGVLNGCRLVGWGGSRTLKTPILWVLHLGWLLLTASIALAGLNELVLFAPRGTFFHLLTIGGLSLTTLGMMARVSLGHTGRKLVLSRLVAAGFVLVVLAMAARVLAPLLSPARYTSLLWLASGAWSLAFAAFVIVYAPILLSPRADGKPG